MKHLGILILALVSGCLAGCVAEGRWEYGGEILGSTWAIHGGPAENNTENKATLTFDDWMKKFIDAWAERQAEAEAKVAADKTTTVEVTGEVKATN